MRLAGCNIQHLPGLEHFLSHLGSATLTELSSEKPIIRTTYSNMAWTRRWWCQLRWVHNSSQGLFVMRLWRISGITLGSWGGWGGSTAKRGSHCLPILKNCLFLVVKTFKISYLCLTIFKSLCLLQYCFLVPFLPNFPFLICIHWTLSLEVFSSDVFKVGKPAVILHLPLILRNNLYLLHFYKIKENSPRLGTLQALPKCVLPTGPVLAITED